MNIPNAIRQFDRRTGCLLGRLEYLWCMATGRPYFGTLYAAGQGIPARYQHMRELVRHLTVEKGVEIRNILEIGSWAGGSALVWAQALHDFNKQSGVIHCVDPWIEYFDKASKNPIHRAMNKAARRDRILPLFLHNTRRWQHMINVFVGTSQKILCLLPSDYFELIYIDGDHSYPVAYQDMFHSSRLLKDGGILCGDDLELQWDEVDTFQLQCLLEEDYAEDSKTGKCFHPGVTQAVRMAFNRRISAKDGFWAQRKTANGWEDVTW